MACCFGEPQDITRDELIANLTNRINCQYEASVKYNLCATRCWRFTSNLTEICGNIFILITTLLAFATGYFENYILAFVAGGVSTAAIMCFKFSSYASKESSERIKKINKILVELNIRQIVDINENDVVEQI